MPIGLQTYSNLKSYFELFLNLVSFETLRIEILHTITYSKLNQI